MTRAHQWWVGATCAVLAGVLVASSGSTAAATTRATAKPVVRAEDAGVPIPAGSRFFFNLEGFVVGMGDQTAVDVGIFDLGERDSVSQLNDEHPDMKYRICYFSLGTREAFRSESDYPPALWDDSNEAAVESARPVPGVEAEFWVRIDAENRSVLRNVIAARIAACNKAGGTGILIDWPDAYLYNELSGFDPPLTFDDALQVAMDVAGSAHAAHMSAGLRNFHEAATQLASVFDFAVVNQCVSLLECDDYKAFTRANKAVLDLEYVTDGDEHTSWSTQSRDQICAASTTFQTKLQVQFTTPGYDAPPMGCDVK